jgi:transcriptional regulator with XRE-family HTH domain
MKENTPDLNQLLAARITRLRADSGLSLDSLAERSDVSRSMISLIERGESNPTAVVLNKLAAALNVTLASLFELAEPGEAPSPLSKRRAQKEWQDPASGYRRRNLSPAGVDNAMQLVEVFFPAGQRVTFDHHTRQVKVSEQIWLMEGVMEVAVGPQLYRLEAGDCLAFQLELPVTFHNPAAEPARYLVARA